MKDFSRQTYNFSTISIGQKLTYSSFLVLMLAGWLTMLAFYFRETGFCKHPPHLLHPTFLRKRHKESSASGS